MIDTVTWSVPVSVNVTVPTDPEMFRLFDVRSKLTESATAKPDPMKTNATASTTDRARYARKAKPPPRNGEINRGSTVHDEDRKGVQKNTTITSFSRAVSEAVGNSPTLRVSATGPRSCTACAENCERFCQLAALVNAF